MASEPRIVEAAAGLVVVDKPSGWVVHATAEDEPLDLRTWLRAAGHPDHAPAHRLDRGASGLVLYASDPVCLEQLGTWFAERAVKKVYQCLVHGRTHRKGIIRAALDGRDSVTRYTMLAAHGRFTYLRVRPQTGRRHQIRRHLHGLGHPLVGDDRYRSKGFRPVPAFPDRLFLHAASLTLPDGRSWTASLPGELQRCLDAVAAGARR